MKGRKPKPSHLKAVQGNPGKRPLNNREPKPQYTMPKCPDWLSLEAKDEWKYVAGELFKMGLLSHVDRAALAAYCQVYARWREAEKFIKITGLVIMTSYGNEIQSPYVGIANKSLEMMHKFLVEFGMTPSSRSRLSVKLPEQLNLLDQYLGNG